MRALAAGQWQPRPAADCAEAALVDAFNDAFADYLIGPPRLAPGQWTGFLRRQGVALASSRVVQEGGGRVLGFALVGPHGRRLRLATLALRPAARGRGIAQALLDGVLEEARRAGAAEAVELEVFVQNARAVTLYRSRGFATVAELRGYERAPGPAARAAEGVQPLPLEAALAWLREPAREALLPMQTSAAALAARAGSLVAWRAGEQAQLVWSVNAGASQVQIASLVDTSPGQTGARMLARALAQAYPQATLRVPQLQRPELGGDALEAEGWQRLALQQWLMRLPLA